MGSIYDSEAIKKPTNLTINSDLVNKVKSLNINISAAVEKALAELVKDSLIKQWRVDNREAIRAYNEGVEAEGCLGDHLRSF